MRLPSRSRVGALLLAAAVLPRPGAFAADLHPLDPATPAGVVPTQDVFEALVPLLNRESPVPSFVAEPPETDVDDAVPVDHGGTDHDAMAHGSLVEEDAE
jgi:hypothetical protein